MATFQTTTKLDPSIVADCVKLGIRHIRWQMDWGLIETAPGVYDWATMDDAVAQCNAANIEIYHPIRNPPPWGCTALCGSDGFKLWGPQEAAVFAGVIAERYNGKNGHGLMDGFEIGNEDFDVHYEKGSPVTPAGQSCRDPKWYIPVLQAVVPVIRAHHPQARIGLFGSWWEDSTHRTTFMEALYAAGCASLFDFANFHIYTGQVPPGQDTNAARKSLQGQGDEIYAVMVKNGDAHKKIWVTEIGWKSPSDIPEATRITFYTQAMDIMRTSPWGEHFDLFTLSYYPTQDYSLVRGTSGSPVYTQTFTSLQQYIAKYPTWGGVTPPPPPPPSPQVITVPLTQFTGTVTALPAVSLSLSGETLTDYTGTVSFTPSSIVPPPPPPSAPALDGVSRFVLASVIPPPPPPPAGVPHILVIPLENAGYSQVMGDTANWTNLNQYAKTYGLATAMYGIAHPSLANYLVWTSGNDHGNPGDIPPPSPRYSETTIVDELAKAGIPWAAYFQSMPGVGYTGGDVNGYMQHHNPFVYYQSIVGTPSQLSCVKPVTDSAGKNWWVDDMTSAAAPAFVWYTPDSNHDAHSGASPAKFKIADTVVGALVSQVQGWPWYTQHNGKIILVFDEALKTDNGGCGDYSPGGGQIYFCVISEASKGKPAYTGKTNLAGFLAMLCAAYGIAPLGTSAHAMNGDPTPLLG